VEENTGELLRVLRRDYMMLGRYAHLSIAESRAMPHVERRAMIDAVMGLIDEENEAQERALRERD
jgi:hypothetical protein